MSPKKVWNARPPNWKIIAEYASQYGYSRLRTVFPEESKKYTDFRLNANVKIWVNDFLKNKPYTPPIRKPCYGTQVEKELLDAVQMRISSGLSIDNTMLRRILIPILGG